MIWRMERGTIDHLEGLSVLFDKYRQFYKQPSDPDTSKRFLKERMERDESWILCAVRTAPDPPEILGFAQMYRMFSSVSLLSGWLINDLFVSDHARNQGIGGDLLLTVISKTSAQGNARLWISTERTNSRARTLYEGVGFRLDERFNNFELTLRTVSSTQIARE
ncbi:MAG: GNAT family N-acetyltransferase [Leptospirales bacterium]